MFILQKNSQSQRNTFKEIISAQELQHFYQLPTRRFVAMDWQAKNKLLAEAFSLNSFADKTSKYKTTQMGIHHGHIDHLSKFVGPPVCSGRQTI